MLQRRAAGTYGLCAGAVGQWAPPGLAKAQLFTAIKDKMVTPQKFRHAEIQICPKKRAHALEAAVVTRSLQGNQTLPVKKE